MIQLEKMFEFFTCCRNEALHLCNVERISNNDTKESMREKKISHIFVRKRPESVPLKQKWRQS